MDSHQEVLRRFIPAFARWMRGSAKGKKSELIATLGEALKTEFGEAEINTLTSRVSRLCENRFLGLELADKVDEVVNATGKEFQSAHLVADIRPVFNEARDRVLAVVPMTTLRIVTEPENAGDVPSVLEARLTEGNVDELCTKLTDAKRKLAVLKKLMQDSNIKIAESDMVAGDGDDL